jgi:hypothetical protein
MATGYFYKLGTLGTAFAILCGTAFADVFHLKDGRRLEGRILSEGEDSYVLEVLVARGIRDEITVAKTDVLRIQPELVDLKDFEEVKKLIPIPDLLEADDYSQRIGAIRKFITTYPESLMLDQAKDILGAHENELQMIEAGGLKLNGLIITPHERLANQYEIDSRIAESKVRRLAQETSHLNALREFKKFEAEFSGSEAWQSLLPLAQQLAAAHKARVQELLAGFDARVARREAGLTRMSVEERQTTLRAIAEREAALNARYQTERNNRDFWPSISQDFKPSLDDSIRFADQEIRRLANASTQALRQPTLSQLWRNAFATIHSGDVNQSRTAIQAARSARMPQHYIDALQKLADEVHRQAEEAKREAERLAEEALKRAAEEAADEAKRLEEEKEAKRREQEEDEE